MTQKYRQEEIKRFLKSEEPGVMCIRGRWGTGKTYAWKKYLKEAVDEGKLSRLSAAYCSLFGINSLTDLKTSMFENTVSGKSLAGESTPTTFYANVLLHYGRKSKAPFKALLSYFGFGSAGDLIAPALFLAVRDQIVCIDDIERKGKTLSLGDVLGLCSYLKEERNCKIVLILNDAELAKEEEEFRTYFEKVIDIPIAFNPTPKECADLVLTEKENLIHRYVVDLQITNIRVIRRIKGLVERVLTALDAREESFIDEATKLIAVLSWVEFVSQDAPPLSFLVNRKVRETGLYMEEGRGETTSEEVEKQRQQEKRWHRCLDAVDFGDLDEFGESLLRGIKDGFFNPDTLAEIALAVRHRIETAERRRAYSDAWTTLLGSLEDNAEEMINLVKTQFQANIEVISPLDLDGIVKFLKNVGQTEEAGRALALFIEKRGHDLQAIHNVIARRHVRDPDVRKALASLSRAAQDERPIEVMWAELAKGTLSHENKDRLKRLEPQDIIHGLKGVKGMYALQHVIETCLGYAEPAVNGKTVAQNFREALKAIAAENQVQAFRLREYVKDEPPDDEEPLKLA